MTALALLLAVAAPAAPSAEKMAVLVLAASEREADLADNVTEVVIGALVRRRNTEVAGKEEFRGRLGVTGDRQAQVCVDDVGCLSRAAVSLGVRRIVTGHVGARGKQWVFSLALNNVESGQTEARVFKLVEGGVDSLVRAVEDASAELFRPRVEPGRIQIRSAPEGARVSIDNAYLGVTPLISGTLLPGKHRVRVEADGRFPWVSQVDVLPGHDLGVELGDANLPPRRRWPRAVTLTTAGLAGLSAAAGAFLGVLSQQPANGATRADIQSGYDQRARLARGANIAYVSAGVLAVVSLYHLIRYHDDVFGRDD